jgi:hypothetical protein
MFSECKIQISNRTYSGISDIRSSCGNPASDFFRSGSRETTDFRGGKVRLVLFVGIMPCCGVPQTTQASPFNLISAPQHAQYAAKNYPQHTLIGCPVQGKDSRWLGELNDERRYELALSMIANKSFWLRRDVDFASIGPKRNRGQSRWSCLH